MFGWYKRDRERAGQKSNLNSDKISEVQASVLSATELWCFEQSSIALAVFIFSVLVFKLRKLI